MRMRRMYEIIVETCRYGNITGNECRGDELSTLASSSKIARKSTSDLASEIFPFEEENGVIR